MKSVLLKLLVVIIFIGLLFLGSNVVYGAELVDFSNATVTLSYSDTAHLQPKVTISGVNFDPNNTYYFQYTNGEETPVPSGGDEYDYGPEWHHIENGIDEIYIRDSLALAGDIYIWFSEFNGEPNDFATPIKVERLPQLPLGKRMRAYFMEDDAGITFYEINLSENLKYKVGQVTDTTLLQNIKNNTDNSMEQLLTYAKNSEGSNEGNVQSSEFKNIRFNNLVNNKYYFVYCEMDTENGKYFSLEDVGLYYANVDSYGYGLYSQTDPNFKWEFPDDNSNNTEDNTNNNNNNTSTNIDNNNNNNNNIQKDDTVAPTVLPKTGVTYMMLFLAFVLIVMGSISYMKFRKINLK